MTIGVWDYRDEYKELREEILAAVDGVFKSGRLILGEHVAAFEREFSDFCNLDTPGVGVNSGTDALFLGLKILGIGPGDEVITVANTAVPTVAAIIAAGARPRFIDIDPDTYQMNAGLLAGAVTEKTKCVLPVHLYGQCGDMDSITSTAKKHGLFVLEDCAQCTGAAQNGRRAGTFGDISAWSFYPTKVLGAYGDGGMITASDPALLEHARSLRMYGMKGRYYAEENGYNSRLDEVQAAILSIKLRHIETWITQRTAIAARYQTDLQSGGLVLPTTAPGNQHAWYLYVVSHPERDAIIESLAQRDIMLNISYPWPIHTMKAYAKLGYKEGDLPETEKAAREIFSLPMYPAFAKADQEQVCSALHEILETLS
jgi:aminotransferase EvaB